MGTKSKRGLSLTQILNHRRSEPQCEQALFKARWRDGRGCPRCGAARFCRLSSGPATLRCNHCKGQLSLLAGTLLQTIMLPLTTWFLAIYLLSQTKNGIAALDLVRKLMLAMRKLADTTGRKARCSWMIPAREARTQAASAGMARGTRRPCRWRCR